MINCNEHGTCESIVQRAYRYGKGGAQLLASISVALWLSMWALQT